MKKIAIFLTHPIQYFSEFFIELNKHFELIVYYFHEQKALDNINSDFGHEFEWNDNLLNDYHFKFLRNVSKNKSVNNFFGCNNPEIYQEIKNKKFDYVIVFGWHTWSYFQSLIACKLTQTKIYVRTDSTLYEKRSIRVKLLKKVLYPLFFSFFDGFLSVGARSRLYLENYFVNKNKIFFSPHFVGNKNFFLEKKINRKKNIFKILSVSSLIERKRVSDTIFACKELAQKGLSIELNIIGTGIQEKYLKDISSNMSFNILFHSFVNQKDLRKFYTGSDVLVLASSEESWGLVVNECLQCGTPAVVSNMVGCGPDLINKQTGKIFKTGDIIDLSQKLLDVYNHNYDENIISNYMKKYSIEYNLNLFKKLMV